MKTASQKAAWAVKNLAEAEEKLAAGAASVEYVEKAEEIMIDAEAEAHYDSVDGRRYRADQKK
jgi:hypothetical protein